MIQRSHNNYTFAATLARCEDQVRFFSDRKTRPDPVTPAASSIAACLHPNDFLPLTVPFQPPRKNVDTVPRFRKAGRRIVIYPSYIRLQKRGHAVYVGHLRRS